MTEENKLAEIKDKLNKALGAKFLDIEEVSPGSYQMLVQLDPANDNHKIILDSVDQPGDVRSLVKERRLDPNSLLARANFRKSPVSDLVERIKEAGERDIAKAVESGKDAKKVAKDCANFEAALLDQRYRDVLTPSTLDLRKITADQQDAVGLYKRSEEEYHKTGVYGTALDLLSNFAATGFHNEHSDKKIKEFYDSWSYDLDFEGILSKIFHNLFKYSVAYILPAVGPYEPHQDGVSSIPGQKPSSSKRSKVAFGISKILKSRGLELDYNKFNNLYDLVEKELGAESDIPVSFMVWDPKTIKVDTSMVFGGQTITITKKGLKPIADAMERQKEGKLSKDEKEMLKLLPSKIKSAALAGEDYVDIDGLISVIYLRKNDFEAYSKPRGSRAFDSFDYKEELKKADFATLDGVYNYILKVTVGDKDNPVTDVNTLNDLSEAFNTPQKAFAVVWNHTLNIEKITGSEIGNILGIKKYEPVNKDITAALGITMALVDGENVSATSGILASKALQSEIAAARKQVEFWIYQQYRKIAMSIKFPSYPVVRWKQTVITTDGDAVTRASWMQLTDRMLVSRQTAQKALGLDPDAELQKLREEMAILQKEGIGLIGSPTQQSPDAGRPKSVPTGTKTPDGTNNPTNRQTKQKNPSQQPQERSFILDSTTISELKKLSEVDRCRLISVLLSEEQKAKLVQMESVWEALHGLANNLDKDNEE